MTRRNKGDMIQVSVPTGTKARVKAYAKKKGLNLSDYVRGLIEADTGIDLTTEMGNPYLRELGQLTEYVDKLTDYGANDPTE